MEPRQPQQRITTGFNILLTQFYILSVACKYLLRAPDNTVTRLDTMLPDSPLGKISILIILGIAIFAFTAVAIQQVWNRCIADVLSLRCIRLAEAYALELLIYILFV